MVVYSRSSDFFRCYRNSLMLFNRIKNKIRYEFLKLIKPETIGYNFDFEGKPLKNVRISNMAHISNRKNITLSDNIVVFHFTYIDGFDKVKLAEGVAIGAYTAVLTHSAHNSLRLYGADYIKYHGPKAKGLISGPVAIGAYTFIGPHCLVMPGATIGKGCVVGAYSVVTGTVPDYAIVKGNPAVVIGDTRKVDEPFLKRYPELKEFYWDKSFIN